MEVHHPFPPTKKRKIQEKYEENKKYRKLIV